MTRAMPLGGKTRASLPSNPLDLFKARGEVARRQTPPEAPVGHRRRLPG